MGINPKQLQIGGSFGQPLTIGRAGFHATNSHVPVNFMGDWFRPSVPTGNNLVTLPSDWRIADGSVCVDFNPSTLIVLLNATGFNVGDSLNFNSGAGLGVVATVSGTTITATLNTAASVIAATGSVTDTTTSHTTTYTVTPLTIAAGVVGVVTNGQHNVAFSFEDESGYESPLSAPVSITIAGNTSISLTVIPTGPDGIVARWIYMTKVGAPTVYYRVFRINDNSTTQLLNTSGVNVADVNLTAQAGPGGGPWNLVALPNASARFMRGHSTLTNANFAADTQYKAGGANVPTGGADTNNLQHSHAYGFNIDHTHGYSVPSHAHGINLDGAHSHNNPANVGNIYFCFNTSAYTMDTTGNHSHGGSTQAASVNGLATGTMNSNNSINGSVNSSLSTVQENRPAFTEFVKIIKIR